ncbi:MAG: WD40 repeat domain-containing protein, partial [Chlorobium sp.]
MILACAFSPDGKWILTAGIDSSARLWDANSGVELFARSAAGNSWVLWSQSEGRWDGEGELIEWLRYEDTGEVPTGEPGWVPRHWLAADLPELRGLSLLPL